jgi:murein DD-endopeptidase MepM/ murein hydrolase activator NlpD
MFNKLMHNTRLKIIYIMLLGLASGLTVSGCANMGTGEARYPIYMQNRPAVPSSQAPNTNGPETNGPETNGPETNWPETNGPETNGPDRDASSIADVPKVGNVTSANLPPPPPPPTKAEIKDDQPAAFIYIMQPKDTLYGVSRRFGVDIKLIYSLNGLSDSASVKIGQKILLPATARDKGAETHASGKGLEPIVALKPLSLKPQDPKLQTQTNSSKPAIATSPTKNEKPERKAFPNQAQLIARGRGLFIWPVKGEVIVKFGQLAPNVRNDGINIAASEGTPVKAAADGVVVYVGGQVKELGNTVYVQNATGWYTGYSHLLAIKVKTNQKIAQGDIIGTVGKSGAVDKPQLHFQIRYTPSAEIAKPIDPALVLP